MSIFSFKTLSRVASAAILIGATAELAHAETTLSLNQAVDGFNNDKIIEEL